MPVGTGPGEPDERAARNGHAAPPPPEAPEAPKPPFPPGWSAFTDARERFLRRLRGDADAEKADDEPEREPD